jgi:hypothetical protein
MLRESRDVTRDDLNNRAHFTVVQGWVRQLRSTLEDFKESDRAFDELRPTVALVPDAVDRVRQMFSFVGASQERLDTWRLEDGNHTRAVFGRFLDTLDDASQHAIAAEEQAGLIAASAVGQLFSRLAATLSDFREEFSEHHEWGHLGVATALDALEETVADVVNRAEALAEATTPDNGGGPILIVEEDEDDDEIVVIEDDEHEDDLDHHTTSPA